LLTASAMARDHLHLSPDECVDRTATGSTSPLILLADPEEGRRAGYADILRQAGFDVAAVPEVTEAMSRAAMAVPALIILQLVNHVGDGFLTCRLVRTSAETRHTPVLVLTRFDDPYTRDQIVRSGATAILIEPLKHALLLRQVRRLLAHANGRRRD
jgi:DNA-binding response OmpR family regulator